MKELITLFQKPNPIETEKPKLKGKALKLLLGKLLWNPDVETEEEFRETVALRFTKIPAQVDAYVAERNSAYEEHISKSIDEVCKERDLNCPQYDACLNFAANKNWGSFSCSACPFFKKPDQP